MNLGDQNCVYKGKKQLLFTRMMRGRSFILHTIHTTLATRRAFRTHTKGLSWKGIWPCRRGGIEAENRFHTVEFAGFIETKLWGVT